MINQNFHNASELLQAFPNEQSCLSHLESLRWAGHIISPFDSFSKVYPCKNNRYRCKNTGKYFNVKTGTLFQNSRVPLQKWFLAIWTVTNQPKTTSVDLAQELGLTQKTAWYILKRINNYLNDQSEIHIRLKQPTSKSKLVTSEKIVQIEEVQESDKLPVTQWLQFLKQ